MGMDDVDNLEGQALADAVAVEVMGWRLADDRHYWLPDEVLRGDWHPESSWSDFGAMVDRVASPSGPGMDIYLELGTEEPYCEFAARRGDKDFHGGEVVGDAIGTCPCIAFCRAALKAVRARRGTP